MSKQTGVFICPSCQNMVQSDGPLEKGVICGECLHEFGKLDEPTETKSTQAPAAPRSKPKTKSAGISRDVTAKRASVAQKGAAVERVAIPVRTLEEVAEDTAKGSRDEERIMPDGSRRVRRRKKRLKKEKNKNLILFLVGWISVVSIIFTLYKMGEGNDKSKEEEVSAEALNEKTMKDEILRRFYPQVVRSFTSFLEYPKTKGREQFINNSAELALPFTKHYQLHAFPTPKSLMRVVANNVIKVSEEDFGIETIWQDKDGNRLGAVHLWDGEAWKLDWENFAPYSTEPWSQFRSRLGKEEGTFRLLVRKRETGDQTKKFFLSCYRPPILYEEAEEFRVTESPEIEIETDSDLGRKFLRLWGENKAGEVPYGSILGKELDPSNYLRLTVALAWGKNKRDEDIMVLKDIVGVSWFGELIQNHYREELRKKKEAEELAR